MKTILLTTAMTVNIVTSSFEQIKSSETIISNYQLDKKQTQKKISFKQTFDNSKLDRVYSLIKKEFNVENQETVIST